jgi:hypothetical protein
MTQTEALRLALEALESGEKMQNGRLVWIEHDISLVKQAIPAIKSELLSRSDGEVKDEPVAWRDVAIRLGEELSSVGPDGYYDMDAKEWLDWAMEQNPRGEHSLPQRTWVGLTNEEISAIDWKSNETLHDFAKAVEAKLKEKNT